MGLWGVVVSLSRRDLVKLSVLGGAAVALPLERSVSGASALTNRIASSRLPAPFTTPFAVPPLISPVRSDEATGTDFYRITMKPTLVEIVPGLSTQMWGYNGLVPGPTFRIQQGRKTVVRQINNLPPVHPVLKYVPYTSVHLHGSVSLPQYDGYASDITNPGEYKDYHYPNTQHARTLWYHDHGVHHTAENVSMGLAGQYHADRRPGAEPPDPARRVRRTPHRRGHDAQQRRVAAVRPQRRVGLLR